MPVVGHKLQRDDDGLARVDQHRRTDGSQGDLNREMRSGVKWAHIRVPGLVATSRVYRSAIRPEQDESGSIRRAEDQRRSLARRVRHPADGNDGAQNQRQKRDKNRTFP
jgi:hypothetical protein